MIVKVKHKSPDIRSLFVIEKLFVHATGHNPEKLYLSSSLILK